MITSPRFEIAHITTQQLVGKDEQVDQNDYGASVAITLGDGIRPVSGEFLSFMFVTIETGSGAVLKPAGTLLLLSIDPIVTAGDTALSAAENSYIVGCVDVTADDWTSDANGGRACILAQPVPFHSLKTIWAVWLHTDATSFNDAAGDDEYLYFDAWYRRDT